MEEQGEQEVGGEMEKGRGSVERSKEETIYPTHASISSPPTIPSRKE
jgi:hypothetical protein